MEVSSLGTRRMHRDSEGDLSQTTLICDGFRPSRFGFDSLRDRAAHSRCNCANSRSGFHCILHRSFPETFLRLYVDDLPLRIGIIYVATVNANGEWEAPAVFVVFHILLAERLVCYRHVFAGRTLQNGGC